MNVLKIEIENHGNIVDIREMPYTSEKEFFLALVSMCDELKVEVPVWTRYEDRALDKKGVARILLNNGDVLKITSRTE